MNTLDVITLAMSRQDGAKAAAVHAYRRGEQSFLNPEQLAAASNRNLIGSEQDHPWVGPVARWLERPCNAAGPHTSDEILIGAGVRTTEKLLRNDQMELARAMQQIGGWHKDRNQTRHNGRKARFWRRVDETG